MKNETKPELTTLAQHASASIVSEPIKKQFEEDTYELSDELIKELTDNIYESVKEEILSKRNKQETDYRPLELITSEYLKSFLILGFGLNGEKVFLGHAKTAEEHYSLIQHLNQTTDNVMNNNYNSRTS